jgi:acetylglutamate/LysW-gamma-L-alpha-aminoadipate kinase
MTVVIKIGGAKAVESAGAISDVRSLRDRGEQLAIVHGGSTRIDDTLERMNLDPEYVETPSGVVGRFTDADTMEVITMVLAGLVNVNLVADLQSQGVAAVGFSGVDGELLTGPRKGAIRVVEEGKERIRRGEHSGRIEDVNVSLLDRMLTAGYTPVIGPPMLADDGVPVNTDADRVAAAVAGSLSARLVMLTDVPGVLEDPDDRESLIEGVRTPAELEAVEDVAGGFMERKVMAAKEALASGAVSVTVVDGTLDSPVSAALNGAGTQFYPEVVQG